MSVGFCNNQLSSLENIGQICIKSGKSGLPTPNKVAKSMVNLIPDDWFDVEPYMNGNIFNKDAYIESHRVIDICCNSGVLLEHFYYKFMQELNRAISNSDEREDYILQNLLYAFCLDSKLVRLLRMHLYWSSKCKGHIYQYNIVSDTGRDLIRARSVLESMKFDIVVGNPPYNNDMYLDFVMLGHRLAKTYDLWITPAKFIGMQSDLNVKLRTMFKSCCLISKYFDKAIDIFNIQLDGGICYYLNGKTNNNNLLLNGNKVSAKSLISFDNDLSIILAKVNPNLISSYNSTVFETCKSYFCSKQPTEVEETKGSGYYLVNDRNRFEIDANFIKHKNEYNNYKVFCVKVNDTPLAHILSPDEVYGRAAVLLGFGDKKYCESIKSFFETRTIWYLVYFSGCGNINTASFRFVPDPGSFDCIFEDKPLDGYTPDENGEYIDADGNKHCSLYVKYKLTQQEINIIESVIRERK